MIDTPDASEIRLAERRVADAKDALRDHVALATASLKARVARSSIRLVVAIAAVSGSFWLGRALRDRGCRNVKSPAQHRSSMLTGILGLGVRHIAPVLVRRVAQMWLEADGARRRHGVPRSNMTG